MAEHTQASEYYYLGFEYGISVEGLTESLVVPYYMTGMIFYL